MTDDSGGDLQRKSLCYYKGFFVIIDAKHYFFSIASFADIWCMRATLPSLVKNQSSFKCVLVTVPSFAVAVSKPQIETTSCSGSSGDFRVVTAFMELLTVP